MIHSLKRILIGFASIAVVAGLAPAAHASEPLVLKPGKIHRGPDIAIPHLDGTTIIDGAVSVKVSAGRVVLHGKSGNAYIATTMSKEGANQKLVRVGPQGTVRVLHKDSNAYLTRLADSGDRVAVAGPGAPTRQTVSVYDARTGEVLAERRFAGSLTLLDLSDQGLVISNFATPMSTYVWDPATDAVRQLNKKMTNFADAELDLLAFYSKDPYFGGCQVVTRFSDPSIRLSRNCDERIEDVSPMGNAPSTWPCSAMGSARRTRWCAPSRVANSRTTRSRAVGSVIWSGRRRPRCCCPPLARSPQPRSAACC